MIDSKETKLQSEIKSLKPDLEGLVSKLKDRGINSYFVDINHPSIKNIGFDVVKVIQPELQPLFLEEILPCLDGERMRRYAPNLKLNNIPHPFM